MEFFDGVVLFFIKYDFKLWIGLKFYELLVGGIVRSCLR